MAKRKKISENGEDIDLGKVSNFVPPHSYDAEQSVLGAILLDNSTIAKAIEIIDKESFYIEKHKIIFDTIVKMFEKAIQVDLVTLTEELRRIGLLDMVGGSTYLAELMEVVPSPSNIEHYCKIVQERYIRRSLMKVADRIWKDCFDDSIDTLEEVDNAERLIFEIAERRFARNYITIKRLTHDAIDSIMLLKEHGRDGLTGVPTGFIDLDNYLGGLQKSDLVIIAARPSVGKTALALSMAYNMGVKKKIPIGFFSLEMSAQQLVLRLISTHSGVNNHKIRTGSFNKDDLRKILANLSDLSSAPIYIDDTPNLNLMELRAKSRRLKTEHKVQAIFIDYLQLIDPPKAESREREISIISRTLKQIAKELDIPVVALSQLNRSVETRGDKKPQLSDLRESGSIEQDADVVLFIYRPEIYGIKIWPDSKLPTEGLAEIIIGKQRNGPTGAIKLSYRKETLEFVNLESRDLKELNVPTQYISDLSEEEFDDEPF
ncbi:MAG: replicative DNA helicase [Candidatus Kapaibacteriales bacterium]